MKLGNDSRNDHYVLQTFKVTQRLESQVPNCKKKQFKEPVLTFHFISLEALGINNVRLDVNNVLDPYLDEISCRKGNQQPFKTGDTIVFCIT